MMSEQLKMAASAVRELPRSKRTLLMVATQEKLKELVEEVEAPSLAQRIFGNSGIGKDSDFTRYALLALGAVPIVATAPVSLPAAALGGMGSALGSAAIAYFYASSGKKSEAKEEVREAPVEPLPGELIERYAEKMQFPEQLVLIDPSVARETFLFEIEHIPQNGCFYLLHPFEDDLYIRVSEYPSVVAAEKIDAFKELASELGAKSISLVQDVIHDTSASANASIPVPNAAATVGGGGSYKASGSVMNNHSVKYGPKDYPPRIPERLKDWVRADTALRSMAHSRITRKELEGRVEINTSSHTGMGAEFMASISGLTGSAKADYAKNTNTKWIFDVEYYPV